MALIKQSDCNNLLEFDAVQLLDINGAHSHWSIRYVTANRIHGNFDDFDTAANATDETIRKNAYKYMMTKEMQPVKVSRRGEKRNLITK